MKFGNFFDNLWRIICIKFYLDSFSFNTSIVRCLGGYFFPDSVVASAAAANN